MFILSPACQRVNHREANQVGLLSSSAQADNRHQASHITLPPAFSSVANQMDHQSCNRWSEAKVGGGRGWGRNHCRNLSLISADSARLSTLLGELNLAPRCWLVAAPLRCTGLICLSREQNLCRCGNEAALTFLPSSCVLIPCGSGPGQFRRPPAQLEGHRDRHGGHPGCHVSGHPLRRPPHTG